ncbi:hypothetical protein L3Q82_020120 [Scortum barcoo]|uniref:Uncharacterized protein n=1 Tax=Scortum barcoo TaxID=214431 RepID=A0ACB8VFC7_9TELE|nr:hypothetical protein L3Q82_020120 [Scortum barcoo]
MDEQAGPGVFFSGGGSGSPGGGNIKAPQPGDFCGGEAARAQYNIPGILHFLQHEWARFEVERAQWEVERAELQIPPTLNTYKLHMPKHLHLFKMAPNRRSIRPYYLPREFSHVIAITNDVHPSLGQRRDAACELLHSVVAQLQTGQQHPQAFLLITGDFNHASLSATLPNFHQYVNCCTRDNKTLDLLSANTAGLQLQLITPPPAGPLRSQTWSICALFTHLCDALRDCFDTTDWEVLCGGHIEQDIDSSLTDCITDYIKLLCRNHRAHQERYRCFSNNKPWVTPDLRALLQEKRTAFQSGDRDELRRVQRDLKQEDQRVQGQLQEENGGPPAAKQREGGLERTPSYLRTGFDTGPTSSPPQPEHRPASPPPAPSACMRPLTTINTSTSTISGALTIPPAFTPPPSPLTTISTVLLSSTPSLS